MDISSHGLGVIVAWCLIILVVATWARGSKLSRILDLQASGALLHLLCVEGRASKVKCGFYNISVVHCVFTKHLCVVALARLGRKSLFGNLFFLRLIP